MAKFSERLAPLTVSVPVVTEWASYTPTGPYTTGTPVYTGKWRRVVDNIELMVDIAFPAATNAALASFSQAQLLNGLGLTVDTTKFPNTTATVIPVGNWNILDDGIAVFGGGVLFNGTSIELFVSTGNAVSASNPLAIGAGDNMSLNVTLPITGWTSHSPSATTANAIVNGGNSFGGALTIGTNDAQPVNIETNGTTKLAISSSGGMTAGTSSGLTERHSVQSDGNLVGNVPDNLHFSILDTRTLATGIGGGIALHGQAVTAAAPAVLGAIRASKNNSTSGDFASTLRFYTRAADSSAVEVIKASSTGGVEITGRTDGVAPSAGKVGSYVASVSSNLSNQSNGAWKTGTGINLTPGVYLISIRASVGTIAPTNVTYGITTTIDSAPISDSTGMTTSINLIDTGNTSSALEARMTAYFVVDATKNYYATIRANNPAGSTYTFGYDISAVRIA